MDCPDPFIRKKKALSNKQKGIVIVIRGIPESGKTCIANLIQKNPEAFLKALAPLIWGSDIPENLNLPVSIIEANDNMKTGHNNVANYSRNRIVSAHSDKQNELRSLLQKGHVCVISNLSIHPRDLKDYINSPKLIKINGVEGKVWELCHVIILNLLPIEFSRQRQLSNMIREQYFNGYILRQQFGIPDLRQFTEDPKSVLQLHQVYFDNKREHLCFNREFDENLKCYIDEELDLFGRMRISPATPENMPCNFLPYCELSSSILEKTLLDIVTDLLKLIDVYAEGFGKTRTSDYRYKHLWIDLSLK